jgi:deazaflavin-dependent oxidoreductase (nitroreductase family)
VTTGIPRFDPAAPRPRYLSVVESVARTRVGRGFAISFIARVDPFLLRLTHGHVGLVVGAPTAGLTTTGARSGQPRTAAVFYFTDGDDVILVASNFGRDHHPSWYHNLKAHPQAVMECGGVKVIYTAAEVFDEAERTRLFALADLLYKGYADYRKTTAAIGRRIPIMRLTAAV